MHNKHQHVFFGPPSALVLHPEVVFVLDCGIDPFPPPQATPTREVIKIVLKLPQPMVGRRRGREQVEGGG